MNHRRVEIAALTIVLTVLSLGVSGATLAWFGNSFSDAGRAWSQVPTMINCHDCGINENVTIAETASIIPSCMLTCQEQAGALTDIDAHHWDYVVAQDNICNFIVWDIFYYNGSANVTADANQLTNWSTHAKNAGGKLVIEQMWLRVGTTEQTQAWQTISDKWYDSVARASGAILSPNGHAWFSAYQINPSLQFIDPAWNDAMHPGEFGSYLNACCFFAAITGVSPVGHTNHKILFEGDSVTLPDSQALFAQQQAWDAYQFFKYPTPARGNARPASESYYAPDFSWTIQRGNLIVTGRSIRDARVLGLDGASLVAHAPITGSCRAVMPAPAGRGPYLVQALSDKGWETLRIKVW